MIGEHVLEEYLQHVETNQKSPFFNGGWSQISRWDRNFRKKFLDFSLQLWQLTIEFSPILSTRAIPLEAFK
jgi:hypothetical protein